MTAQPIISVPKLLPFHGGGFGWDHFESFSGAYLVAGTTLPHPDVAAGGPARLRIINAVRYGSGGHTQLGIDFLATMENQATWVLQCKHTPNFTAAAAKKAIKKAESEFGANHCVARYLLWTTGKVAPEAVSLVHTQHPNWTLWGGEEVSNQFLLYTDRRQCVEIISRSFGADWAKALFPLPDDLLISPKDFYSHWDGEGKLFHHHAFFVGRPAKLEQAVAFARGGKGDRAMILSASGGIGKTRFLRAVAERVAELNPERCLRFTNPAANLNAEPPRYADTSKLTIFHDDAHRVETLSKLLLRVLTVPKTEGSRLILATRPDAIDALRERLMEAGYLSSNIEQIELKKLKSTEMEQLAGACLGSSRSAYASSLAKIADGCALITVVGGELLRQGKLTHLDLIQNSDFRDEVFRHFEGQELDRLQGSLDRGIFVKLLRAIALVSPWDHQSTTESEAMAKFLGINRGQVDAAIDRLRANGLLLASGNRLRITPDLFSDHLAYAACYNEQGQATEFIGRFPKSFLETHAQTILTNVAVVEWRANRQPPNGLKSIIDPLWEEFRKRFAQASFRQRSEMVGRWKPFAVYQPKRTLELAGWALNLKTAPTESDPTSPESFLGSLLGWDTEADTPDQLQSELPGLLKPIAIWSDEYRSMALTLLWRVREEFPGAKSGAHVFRDGVFAEIADFGTNFPSAPQGILDWLEDLLTREDARSVVDQPSLLLPIILEPYFVPVLKKSWMSDSHTISRATYPISLSKTEPLRDRAFLILTEKIVPRGPVAALNALSILNAAFSQRGAFNGVSPEVERAWRPERLRALEAIGAVAKRYVHPVVHYGIRHRLGGFLVYKWGIEFRPACQAIIDALPDTFELRLARLTLSGDHQDLLIAYSAENQDENRELQQRHWQELKAQVAKELFVRYPMADGLHGFLNEWSRSCTEFGFSAQFRELLQEMVKQNQTLGLELLDLIHSESASLHADEAAALIDESGPEFSPLAERAIVRGLQSPQPAITQSFLKFIQYSQRVIPAAVDAALMGLALKSKGPVLRTLFGMVQYTRIPKSAPRLLLRLLSRNLSDEETVMLADSVYHNLMAGGTELGEQEIFRMLDRLAQAQVLKTSFQEPGFLPEAAHRFPRRVYQLFVDRIEQAQANGNAKYEAIPNLANLSFQGLENEPDFEDLACNLFHRVFAAAPAHRPSWIQLFQMAISRISPFIEPLVVEKLPQITLVDDLSDLASLLGFEGSLLVFQYPQLTEAILKQAQNFGLEASDRIARDLIVNSGPRSRGYTNGELNPESRYLWTEAEKAAQIHESNRILAPFYQRILEREVRDQEFHRKDYDARMEREL